MLYIHSLSRPLSSSSPRHRDPNSHSCAPIHDDTVEPVPEKNAVAKALLAKHFGPDTATAAARTRSSVSKASSRKEAQQRQLAVMKMRHNAQPGNPKDTPASVPLDQRLHVKVSRVGVPSSERIFWFPKVSSMFCLSFSSSAILCTGRQWELAKLLICLLRNSN